MDSQQIVIAGGSGFVGSHLSSRLAQEGHRIRILTRKKKKSSPVAWQENIEWIECDVHNPDELNEAFSDAGIAINLVGILNERGHNGRGFHHAHVTLTKKIIQACHHNGIKRLLHMSALGADAINGPSFYLRSKGEAENAVHSSDLKVTSFRPSVIFGEGDAFLNRFAHLMAIPGPFPLACASARFAPVWVGDVVECFALAISNDQTIGQGYDLCGPKIYSLEELVRYTATLLGKRKWIIPLGDNISAIQARILELVPGKPFSRDNLDSTRSPSVCDEAFPAVFGIQPHALESIVPDYLS